MEGQELKLGIKNILEIMDAMKIVAASVKKISADGKVSVADLVHLVDIFKNYDVLSLAVQDAGEVVKEIKDLDSEEANQILAKVFEIVASFKAA